MRLQVAVFTMCALIQAAAYLSWRKNAGAADGADAQQRPNWQHRGLFTAFACLGSVAGALFNAARIGASRATYSAGKLEMKMIADRNAVLLLQLKEFRAQELGFIAAETSLFPFELFFVIVAKLFILDRMHKVAATNAAGMLKWHNLRRVFTAAVIIGLVVGATGNLFAAASFTQAAGLSTDAAASWAANNTAAFQSLDQRCRDAVAQGVRIASVRSDTYCRIKRINVLSQYIYVTLWSGATLC